MGRNAKRRKHTHDLGRPADANLIGLSARNEWREFVRETSTAKFYAMGFCVLCGGITFAGLVASVVFGSQRDFRLENLVLASGSYSVFCKLKRWVSGRRLSPAK
jgi:hypothetical protein